MKRRNLLAIATLALGALGAAACGGPNAAQTFAHYQADLQPIRDSGGANNIDGFAAACHTSAKKLKAGPWPSWFQADAQAIGTRLDTIYKDIEATNLIALGVDEKALGQDTHRAQRALLAHGAKIPKQDRVK